MPSTSTRPPESRRRPGHRARRRRRRRLRRAGQTSMVLGGLVVALAVFLAARAGLDLLQGDDPPAAPEGLPDLAPTTAPDRRATGPTVEVVAPVPAAEATSELALDTRSGEVRIAVPAADGRPRQNRPPVVFAPARVTPGQTGEGIRITLDDPDTETGDFGVLLRIRGAVFLASTDGLRLFGEDGSGYVPMVGPLDRLNAALDGVRIEPDGGQGTLEVIITDYGHGELRRAGTSRARIDIVER